MADTTPDGYRLISADSHVNEPPDLWTDAGAGGAAATGRRGSSASSRATPGCSKGSPTRSRSA